MKALTIIQPWATAIYLGYKEIETRSWATKYRGPLLIHAGANKDYLPHKRDGFPGPFSNNWSGKLAMDTMNLPLDSEFPLGCVICKVDLYDCKPTEELRSEINDRERTLGDYSEGRFGWMLRDVHWLKTTIHYCGKLGLWDFPDIFLEGNLA